MIKNICVPKDLQSANVTVNEVMVKRGDRILRDTVLVNLLVGDTVTPVVSVYDGWVKYVAAKENKAVALGDLLLVVDVISTIDYRIDGEEVSVYTELGESGRRGAERDGQRKFGKGYSAELFDAPERESAKSTENEKASSTGSAGRGRGAMGKESSLKENPLMKNMKESLPPKMKANAAVNGVAIKQLAEEAGNDPELRKQLSSELKQQLEIQIAPSAAPTHRAS